MARLVLGINSAHGDSSAALVGETGLIAAIAEERINRKKHCGGFPTLAVQEVLRLAGATASDLTDIAVARDPRANLVAKLAFVVRHPVVNGPRALSRLRIHRKVASSRELMAEALGVPHEALRARFHQVEHHLAHVASAFYPSPLERATGFSCDNTGDFATSMIASCEGTRIHVRRRGLWPHSLGVLYTAICQYVGFTKFGEEYKVMGLSAYGVNRFAPEMRRLASYEQGRGIVLDLGYFRHHLITEGLIEGENGQILVPQLWGERMQALFGPPRLPQASLTDRDRDLAASLQVRFEEIYLDLVAGAVQETGTRDVVMAGRSSIRWGTAGSLPSVWWTARTSTRPRPTTGRRPGPPFT
jgi:carbamoyltransferase